MKIICVGQNYLEHIKELSNVKSKEPLVFLKPDTALIPKDRSFFIPNFNGGGAENSACELANEFVRNNIDTEIITLIDKGPTKKILSSTINIKSLNTKKMILSLFKFSNYVKKSNPNFIITNLNHSSFIALISKKLFKLNYKIVITFVNKINLNLNPYLETVV